MTITTLSKSEAAILQCLGGAPNKAASHDTARKFALLTNTGYYRVRNRMMARNLIAWTDDCRGIQITFGGLRAIGAA